MAVFVASDGHKTAITRWSEIGFGAIFCDVKGPLKAAASKG